MKRYECIITNDVVTEVKLREDEWYSYHLGTHPPRGTIDAYPCFFVAALDELDAFILMTKWIKLGRPLTTLRDEWAEPAEISGFYQVEVGDA